MALLKASIKLVTPEKNTDIETFEELSLKQGSWHLVGNIFFFKCKKNSHKDG